MNKIKVGLFYGGKSFEHEVSLMTAKSFENNIDRDKFEVTKIFIGKDGRFDRGLLKNIEVALLAVHGPNCEDGKLQELFEQCGLKYTGSKTKASRINMDKIKMHQAFRDAGIRTVDFFGCNKNEKAEDIEGIIKQTFDYPCFVKPNNAGSSVGISKAKNYNELKDALLNASQYNNKLIIEQAIDRPREIEVGILGNKKLIISEPGEVMTGGKVFTYHHKYYKDLVKVETENLSQVQADTFKEMAERAYRRTGCRGYARVDFLMDEEGRIYLNEINTLPGCTQNSIFPKMMAAMGIPYKELITKIINLAFEY